MQNLGTVLGDFASLALGINDSGEAGLSLEGSFNPRAFLWENGVMTDLNSASIQGLQILDSKP